MTMPRFESSGPPQLMPMASGLSSFTIRPANASRTSFHESPAVGNSSRDKIFIEPPSAVPVEMAHFVPPMSRPIFLLYCGAERMIDRQVQLLDLVGLDFRHLDGDIGDFRQF